MRKFLREHLPWPVKVAIKFPFLAAIRILRIVIRGIFLCLRLMTGKRMFIRLLHFVRREIVTTMEVGGIKFEVSNYIPYTRAVTLFTKEPETIAWIDDRVLPGDVFYDIGANIGVFSLYSAKVKKAKVIAFEPHAKSYGILNENIFLNDLLGLVLAFNLAVHEETKISTLHVSEMYAGKAGNSFDEPIGSTGQMFEPMFLQGVLGVSLDDFIDSFDMPFPRHIKIDVDGNEDKVVAGMKKTLLDSRLSTIAVELSSQYQLHVDVTPIIEASGFVQDTNPRYRNPAIGLGSYVVNKIFIRPDDD